MLVTAASSGLAAEGRVAPAAGQLSSRDSGQAIPGFSELETQPLAAEPTVPAPEQTDAAAEPAVATSTTAPASLQALVAATPVGDEVSPELKCLASAIYYEARSESLQGQLAVGRVIVNRSRSGRFPGSYCGVVYQRSQFSFIHAAHGGINARQWHNAVALAQIAHDGSWQCEAEGALYFHAARVSPNWGRQKVARIDNHIFYR